MKHLGVSSTQEMLHSLEEIIPTIIGKSLQALRQFNKVLKLPDVARNNDAKGLQPCWPSVSSVRIQGLSTFHETTEEISLKSWALN